MKISTDEVTGIMLGFGFLQTGRFQNFQRNQHCLLAITNRSARCVTRHFAGKEWNKEKLEEMMQLPLKKAKELGIQVCCAEYGAMVNTQ
jgi:hypothetical protein